MRSLLVILCLAPSLGYRPGHNAGQRPILPPKQDLSRRDVLNSAVLVGALVANAALPWRADAADFSSYVSAASDEMKVFDVDGDGKLSVAERALQKMLKSAGQAQQELVAATPAA